LTAWERVGHGIDLSPAQAMSLNNIYVRTLAPAELLDDGRSARTWDEIDFSVANRTTRKGEARWTPSGGTTIYGFATWWVAELVPGISLSTAPDAPRTHWEQLYLPLMRPIKLRRDETIAIALRSRTSMQAGTDITWTVTRADRSGKVLE